MLVFVNEKKEKVHFGFQSKSLTQAESRLPPIEGEVLALKQALKKVGKEIILFDKVKIVTDHLQLIHLLKCDLVKENINMFLRNKLLSILKYNIPVQYENGSKNMADSLSRLVLKNNEKEE